MKGSELMMTNHTEQIGQALFVVNRHTKTAIDPSFLYQLKKETMNKLLKEQKAVKVGLHFSNNPKNSKQHSVMLIKVGDYYFHLPPSKEDMKQLEHLGKLDESYRNPRPNLSLNKAKNILAHYINRKIPKNKVKPTSAFHRSPISNHSRFFHKK